MPGIRGAMRTPESMPLERSSATASRRAAGLGVWGSVARQASSSRVGTERLTEIGRRFGHALVDLDVAQQQRRLGQHRDRRLRLLKRRENLRHEAVAALDPLIGIGVRPKGDQVALPARPRQLGPQQLRHVDLDHDLALEVPPGVEVEIGVRPPGEAVDAGMSAAAEGVDRPAESVAPSGDPVQCRLGANLVEPDTECLRRIERPHDRFLGQAEQPARSPPSQPVARPSACEHTFA